MIDISKNLRAADPKAMASRFGSAPKPKARAPEPGPQAQADAALMDHYRRKAAASLALRTDMWAPAAEVEYNPPPPRSPKSLFDALLS